MKGGRGAGVRVRKCNHALVEAKVLRCTFFLRNIDMEAQKTYPFAGFICFFQLDFFIKCFSILSF